MKLSRRFFSPGFTLIELLVVTGIVSVLVAILVPAASHAKELSKRSVCLSNLRETHRAFFYYAAENQDQVPLGYRVTKQFNSMLYSSTASPKAYVLLGLLYIGGFATQPRVLYCPSETSAQSLAQNNPLPADGTKSLYAGYGTRPEVLISDQILPPVVLPHLNDFKLNAILADLTANAARVNTRHIQGVNALYCDGSANWIPRSGIDPPLSLCGNPSALNTADNAHMDAIWAALDR